MGAQRSVAERDGEGDMFADDDDEDEKRSSSNDPPLMQSPTDIPILPPPIQVIIQDELT